VHQRALAGEACSAGRDPYHRVDGKIDWTRWECRPWYAADGMIGGIIVYTEVITERVLEEEALRKANLVVEKSPVVLFRWRAAEGWPVAMVSQNVVQFGYTQEEFLSGAVPFASIVHPEDLDRVRREVQEYSAGAMDRFRQEYRIVTKNGEVRWVDDRTIVERNTDGQIDHYQGIVIDITERKLAEEALRDSEERYRALFEGAAEGIAVADLGTKLILYANPSYCEMYGYSVEQLVQLRVEDLHPTESLAEVVAEFEAQARGHKTLATNIPCLRKDGSVFFVDINTRPMVIAGRPVVVGFFIDITERKRAEAALRALSVRQQAMLAAIPDILMEVDHRRIYTWANQAGLDFFGADVLGREASAYFEGEQDTYNTVEPLFQGGEEVIYVESWQRRRDGQKRLLAWWCRVLKDEQGRVTGALSSARDITDAKQAEAALRESEERFSVFMTHLPASAFIKDAEGRMVFANRYLQELFGIQDYAGKTTPELIPGELAVQMTEDDRRALAEGILSTQQTFRDTQGRERTFETLKFPIHTTGKPVRLGGVALDITGLKQTEAALRASLEEKTALLQEVHHRVKNNLQIVSSLLNLQASQEKSQPVLAALRETQNRVRSMAMLHEMLYRSESLARINIAAYLEGLCAHLFRAFGADPERVRLDCRTTAVELGLAQAVPCGLIVNELVSNALEHAFPQGRAGRITVEMRRDADDRLVLGVADDGVGLPAGLDFSQTATLGLQLVRILTTQLKGTLGVSRGQGSAFQVTFPSC
jgi:PAS domain S-box-containing protein